MSVINFSVPIFPYFVTAGSALYRPGDMHRSRTSIGVFDLIYVEYGELFLTDNNTSYTISAGDYLILNPSGKHYSEKRVEKETLYHWLHFNHDGEYVISDNVINLSRKSASLYIPSKSNLAVPVYQHLNPEAQKEFLRIHSELSSLLFDNYKHSLVPISRQPASAITSQKLLLQLFEIIQLREQPGRKLHLAESVMFFLKDNYRKYIDLDTLSKAFHFHPAHIIRVMKEAYGVTPIEALNTIRLSAASQYLNESSRTVAEIAEETGFRSASYFSRAFRQKYGMTPREYRSRSHTGQDAQ